MCWMAKNLVASFPGPTQFSSLAVHTASDEKPARAWELGYFLSNDLFGGQTTKSVLFIDKDIQEFTAEDIQGVQFIDKDIQESSCSLTMISSNVLLTDKDIQECTVH